MRLRGWRKVAFYTIGSLLLVWTIFPVYYMITLSLVPEEDLFKPRLYVAQPTLDNYRQTTHQSNYLVSEFWIQLYNSVIIALLTTAAVVIVGTLGSFALARIRFRGNQIISSMTLFTYIIPASFLSIPFFKLMADYDLLGTKLSVILAMITFTSPYAVWILWDYGKTVPPDIDEAAAIDGAGTLAIFLRIYLPLIMPPMIAIATYAFLFSWNEYLYVVLFLSGETNITIPVAMGNFLATDNPPWNLLMAESVLYSIPPVILYYFFRRHLLSGLVTGAVTGT
ncbi:MAG TPA: carbohydrate ABC transporter permease [Thermodesulfobacteriota bacterium]|nr:carbohydrate ABC transporter permease [Thermodesulfobacteriota bacterium]